MRDWRCRPARISLRAAYHKRFEPRSFGFLMEKNEELPNLSKLGQGQISIVAKLSAAYTM